MPGRIRKRSPLKLPGMHSYIFDEQVLKELLFQRSHIWHLALRGLLTNLVLELSSTLQMGQQQSSLTSGTHTSLLREKGFFLVTQHNIIVIGSLM